MKNTEIDQTNQDLTGNKTHKVFGIKENAEYVYREGAYFIPYRNTQIAVIRTPKGYFFLGGGLENGEGHLHCIERECLEEAGWLPCVNGKLCSAETYCLHPTIGYFHPIQTYYYGELVEQVSTPTEKDHVLCWIEYDRLKGKMFAQMQNWALDQLFVQVLNS